ncbi:MAG: hypothetical protein AAB614_00460 [Patescibacteria group bacterium]
MNTNKRSVVALQDVAIATISILLIVLYVYQVYTNTMPEFIPITLLSAFLGVLYEGPVTRSLSRIEKVLDFIRTHILVVAILFNILYTEQFHYVMIFFILVILCLEVKTTLLTNNFLSKIVLPLRDYAIVTRVLEAWEWHYFLVGMVFTIQQYNLPEEYRIINASVTLAILAVLRLENILLLQDLLQKMSVLNKNL